MKYTLLLGALTCTLSMYPWNSRDDRERESYKKDHESKYKKGHFHDNADEDIETQLLPRPVNPETGEQESYFRGKPKRGITHPATVEEGPHGEEVVTRRTHRFPHRRYYQEERYVERPEGQETVVRRRRVVAPRRRYVTETRTYERPSHQEVWEERE